MRYFLCNGAGANRPQPPRARFRVSMDRGVRLLRPSAASAVAGFAAGALAGAAVLALWLRRLRRNLPLLLERARHERLPPLVVLVRHGESQGNADHTLYRTKPDNLIEVTELGTEQAEAAGRRIRGIVGSRRAHLFVSPFQRTLQTARSIERAFDAGQIVRTSIDPRIREQEFGNLQEPGPHRRDHALLRQEQQIVGRFWSVFAPHTGRNLSTAPLHAPCALSRYRFPTGESGADVYDRVRTWWESAVLRVNQLPSSDTGCEAVVVVTHGLTMRLILMQLYGWSPKTFHTATPAPPRRLPTTRCSAFFTPLPALAAF